MAGEWLSLTLRQAGVTLLDCDHRTPPEAESGYPYIAIPQIAGGRIDFASARTISREHLLDWTRKTRPQPGDVILSRRCNPGETAWVKDATEFALGQNLVLLRADRRALLPEFLRWVVRGPEWWDQIRMFLNVGAVFDSLRCQDVPEFRLTVPPLPEQRAIARILGTLDDKIELNRRMNETLEAMARALFKSWFVDFDPVRAKAAGRETGLARDDAGLLPDRLADSELGEVPAGWHVVGLDEVATFLNGLALQKYPPEGGETLPVIKIAQLRKGDVVGADRCSADLPPAYVVDDGDVLFSWSGSLEVEIWCGGRGALNQHLFKVDSAATPKWLCYLWTRHHLPMFREIAADKATTMGHIQRRHLSEARCVAPPRELVKALTPVFGPLVDRRVACAIESRTLAALRDALLPKLLSGELRVPDAERLVEAAGW